MAVAVDHAVVNVLYRMDEAVARFRALGFTPTERGHHSLGSINHLMMFGRDYLELVGLEPGATKVRREVADSPVGLNGLVFDCDDARALHSRLHGAGVPVLPPVDFDRPVHIDGRTEHAAFTTVRIDPQHLSGGRVYFCEHKTRHLVWQPQWQHHANTALALASFTVVVADPHEEARRYRAILHCAAHPAGAEAVELVLGDFRIVLCTPAHYRARYGTFGCSDSLAPHGSARAAYMGALAIRVAALPPLRECLARPEAAGILWAGDRGGACVAAASAYDCVIEFTP